MRAVSQYTISDLSDGFNQATILLYQRSDSVPDLPSSNTTYIFDTGSLSVVPSGWHTTIPTTDGTPCWVISVVAISQSNTFTIAPGAWSEPAKLAEDGEKGETGVGYIEEKRLYYLNNSSTSAPSKPTSEVTSTSTSANIWTINCPPWQSGYYYWICHQFKKTDNTFSWTDVILDRALSTANENAASAMDAANSKAQVYYKTSSPPSSGTYNTGDIWVVQSYSGTDGGTVWYYDGSKWVQHMTGTTSIVGGAITTDLIAAGAITADQVSAEIVTASLLQSYARSQGLFEADIERAVEAISKMDGVASVTPYYRSWSSSIQPPGLPCSYFHATEGTTFVNSDDYVAFDGIDVTASDGYVAIPGATNGEWDTELWSTTRPNLATGEYLWVVYYVMYTDGHSDWINRFCAMDVALDQNLISAYSKIEQTKDSILLAVGNDIDNTYSRIEQKVNSISLSVTNNTSSKSASISLLVDGNEQSSGTISLDGYVTFTNLAEAAGETYINGANIITGTLTSKNIKLYGEMDVYTDSTLGTHGGYIGYMSGLDGVGNTTDGIALIGEGSANYIIATDSGVRMTHIYNGKTRSLYIADGQIVASGPLRVTGVFRSYEHIYAHRSLLLGYYDDNDDFVTRVELARSTADNGFIKIYASDGAYKQLSYTWMKWVEEAIAALQS